MIRALNAWTGHLVPCASNVSSRFPATEATVSSVWPVSRNANVAGSDQVVVVR